MLTAGFENKMRLIKKFFYYLRQIKGYLTFGRRVYVHGKFKVVNSKNVTIGERCSVNEGVFILGQCQIQIGNDVTLSARSMLIDSGLDFQSSEHRHIDGYIVIEDGVWIGAGAIVLPRVSVGKGSVVGAGSVVTRDVPAGVLVAGNPARVIRQLDHVKLKI